jgi:hypothetical protein
MIFTSLNLNVKDKLELESKVTQGPMSIYNIIPTPARLTEIDGVFSFTKETKV